MSTTYHCTTVRDFNTMLRDIRPLFFPSRSGSTIQEATPFMSLPCFLSPRHGWPSCFSPTMIG